LNIRSVLAIGAFAIAHFCSAAEGPAVTREVLTLHVHVYNLANVGGRTLERALDETTCILVAAGIQTLWEPGDPDSPEAHMSDFSASAQDKPDARNFLVVRMVRGFPANIRPSALGYSLPAAQRGAHVTMFYDRIENVSLGVPPTVQKILGDALAHEIGHLLLGSGEHSRRGIMKEIWTRADYQRLAVRSLEFEPRDALAMLKEVSRRAVYSGLKER
jgi:hypothetical protein